MLRKKSLFLLICLFSLTSLFADIHSENEGWNSRELVTMYFHNSELQTQWAIEALFKTRLKGDERILDFGCGDGKISALMSFIVPEGNVTGVDLSKEMCTFAANMFFYPNLSFVHTEEADFSDFVSIQKFDIVTSFCVFHLIPNPVTVLSNLRSWMKPQGKLVMTFLIGGNPEFYAAAKKEMKLRGLEMPMSSVVFKIRTFEGAKEILTTAGFIIDRIEIVHTKNAFGSQKELLDWLEGTLSANWHIPEEQRRDFFGAVMKRYLDARPDAQGPDGFVYLFLDRLDIIASNG